MCGDETKTNLNIIEIKKTKYVLNYAPRFASCSGVNQVDGLPPVSNKGAARLAGLRVTAKPVRGQASFNSMNLTSPPKGDVQENIRAA